MIIKYTPIYKEQLVELGKQYDIKFESKYLNNNNQIYIYLDNGLIVGFLITEETVDEYSIILVYVDKAKRHKRIGTLLLDYFISDLKNIKKRIILEVSSTNEIAINLYEKFGFKTINIRKKYYNNQTDALIMERVIDNE